MELGNNYKNSYGTSWADQWDPQPEYHAHPPQSSKKKNSSSSSGTSSGMASKYGKIVGDGFGKIKSLASKGAKKVKGGTSLALQWIKQKYHK